MKSRITGAKSPVSRHPHRSPRFKRAALALAITSAMAPMAVPASEWNRNIEVYLMPSTQGRLLYGGALLQPLWQDNNSLFYGDLRGTITQMDGKDTEFNFGLGYRWLTPNRDWILGGYAAFDTRDTLNDNRFNQVTFGVEALGDMYDARFNYYVPVTDEKRLDTAPDGGLFQGHTLFANGIFEEALQGFDGEVGVRIPWIDFAETRAYIGGYHFDGSVTPKAADGVKGRLEVRLMQDISLGVSAQSDDLFGGETMLQLRYSFGYPNVNRKRTVPERMIQFVERDVDIKATDRLPPVQGLHGEFHGIESANDDLGHKSTISTSVFHIDNTAAAGGDGSFEHPYNTVNSCLAGGCAQMGSFVYVHAGNGTSTGYNALFTMANNQTLWGQGFPLFGIGGDRFPILTNTGGDVIHLANNNEIAGLQIDGAEGSGIFGQNVSGTISIHNNRFIDNHGRGDIFIYNSVGAGQTLTQNLSIKNNFFYHKTSSDNDVYLHNSVSGNGQLTQTVDIVGNTFLGTNLSGNDPLYIHNNTDGTSKLTQTVNITGNTFSHTGDNGIYLHNEAYDHSTLTQVANITNNSITNANDHGIKIIDIAKYNAVISQTSTITGNTISGNGERGIFVYNKAYNDGGHITQTLTIANNTITNNHYSGIYLKNRAYYHGSITQTVSISNNTISGNVLNGIFVYNRAFYRSGGGTIGQTLNIANNTITNNGRNGIYFHNKAGYASVVTQMATLSNNTITGNTRNGIYLHNYAYDGGRITQTATLAGNTISGNGRNGIYLHNYASNSAIATQTVDLSGGGNVVTNNSQYGVKIINNYSGGTTIQTVNLKGSTISGNNGGGQQVYYNGVPTQTVTLP